MKLVKPRAWLILIGGLALSVALSSQLFSSGPLKGHPTPLATSHKSAGVTHGEPPSGPPVRLRIPKIGVDAAIDPMGVTPSGEMEAYGGPRRVGWFKFGAHPGERGSAVLAGHYGRWVNGEGSVFDELGRLRRGDSLYVQDKNGVTTAFVVRESRSYDPKADASEVFGSRVGGSHLNLVTCEGVWDAASRSYPQRLVVFTDKG